MEIIKKSVMPDKTLIQIEDWTRDYPCVYDCYIIAAYPIAKNSSQYGFIRGGDNFRLGLERFANNEEVNDTFVKLENGKLKLEALTEHYRDPRDAYYMGIVFDWV